MQGRTISLEGESVRVRACDECPRCHKAIEAIFHSKHRKDGYKLTVVFMCPGCQELFFVQYEFHAQTRTFEIKSVEPRIVKKPEVSSIICELSPKFLEIYIQASIARQNGLNLICGAGYRKAFEHLIKDFSIKINSPEKDKISKMPLNQVIQQYITYPKVKKYATTATWLSNDHVHYEEKWPEYDLKNLINMIEVCMHHIHAELLCDQNATAMIKKQA